MGLSSSTTKTKTNQRESSSSVMSPTNPVMVTQAMEDYLGRVKWFGAQDPNRFVAGASPLQQQAFKQAGNLGNSALFGQAAGIAGGVAGAGAPSATAQGYQAPNMGAAAQAAAASYNAPQLGQASTYGAPQLGPAAQAGGVNIDPTRDAQAQSLLTNFAKYQSPYTKNVVNAAMADFDDFAGRQEAELAARGAKAGAFGGSRFGIAEAELQGQLSRGRNTQLSGLLDQGFRTAASLSGQDADRRQQVSLNNAQATNARALAQAGLTQERNFYNTGAQNQFGLAQAGMNESAARYGADARNQFALSQAGFDQNAGQFNAGNQQQANMFNATAQNSQSQQQAALEAAARQFSAGAANQNSQFNAGMQSDALMRQLQAAGLLGDLGNSQQANQRSNIELTGTLGAQQQQIEQMRRLAPLAQIEAMGGLYNNGIPLELFKGGNVNTTGQMSGTTKGSSTPSLFSQGLAAAQVASMFSDRRLKRDIERIGEMDSGLGVYRYKYVWDDEERTGVMADEVADIAPHALGPVIAGYATVDYAKIEGWF